MKEIIISEKFNITAKIEKVGDDILVIIAGGDVPHIGAVSVGISGPGVGAAGYDAQPDKFLATYTCPSHRDNYISEPVACGLSKQLSKNVVVLTGIHIDHLPPEEIREIQNLVPEIISKITAASVLS